MQAGAVDDVDDPLNPPRTKYKKVATGGEGEKKYVQVNGGVMMVGGCAGEIKKKCEMGGRCGMIVVDRKKGISSSR